MVLRIPKPSISTFFVIIPILYFNSCTFEFIKQYSFVLPVVALSALSWCFFLLKENVTQLLGRIFPMLLSVLFFAVLFVLGLQSNITVLTNEFFNMVYLLFFMCVFWVYSKEDYENDRNIILFIWITDVVIASIYSSIRLIADPNLARLLSTGSYHSTSAAAAARGIVSFGVIYGLTFVLITLFTFIIKKKGNMLLNIILFALFTTVLFLAQFLIAILLVGIGILIVLLSSSRSGTVNLKNRLFIITIVGICLIFIMPFVLQFLVESELFGYEINKRIEEILTFVNGENLEGTDMSVRFLQYTMSIGGFFSTFGLGRIFFPSTIVGAHSQWLDGFGNYGIFYAIYIFALFVFLKFIIESLPNKGTKYLYKLLVIIYVVMSITNTSTWAPITLSLFVMVPFLCMEQHSEPDEEPALLAE